MASNANESDHQGRVKDPEHDGRLKENREAGRTKSTTDGSAARQHGGGDNTHADEGDHGPSSRRQGGSHEQHASTGSGSGGAKASGSHASDTDDLKSREYTDAQGNVHHHTKAYMEQHGKG